MKKISLPVYVAGILLLLFSNAYAYPDSISIDSQQHSGNDYTTGFQLFFEAGTYEFSVGSGAWNMDGSFPGEWVWSANVYQESTDLDLMLGDTCMHDTSDEALTSHLNDTPVQIVVDNPSGEYLYFYIKDNGAYDNRHAVTMNVEDISDSCPVPTVRIF